ncbi:MAG: carbohydrate deacetylase [Anaerolineales bacterium]|nr:carbohydrate deacetylase [Anaerolineales bacterium]
MPKQLIINSDDYGRTSDISRGIRESHTNGVVTSTTCMMNIPTTSADIEVALRETPNLGLGVHLVLTAERPLLSREQLKTITNDDGSFLKLPILLSKVNQIDVEEVKAEWHAQVELFVKTTGRNPTHLDSHHHSSYFSPALFRAMLELAKEYDCAIRFPFTHDISRELEETFKEVPSLIKEFNPRRPDVFIVDFYDEKATHEELLGIINNVKDGSTEVMCHPGYVDDAFAKESSYNKQRETELEGLTDPAIKDAIQKNYIELTTFANL